MFNKLKAVVRKFDEILFNSQIQNSFYKRKVFISLRSFETDKTNHLAKSYFSKDLNNPLSYLCDKYGSDKGELDNKDQPYTWAAHSYSDYYMRLFGHCRFNIKKVFECGIGSSNTNIPCSMGEMGKPGASLRVWREYFPNATIYGADIDKDILFAEERIKTFFINQLDSSSIIRFWDTVNTNDFDIIIDDGLHTFDAGINLFRNSINSLSKTGIYIIEDVKIDDLILYRDFFEGKKYNVDYVMLQQPKLLPEFIIVIRKKQFL